MREKTSRKNYGPTRKFIRTNRVITLVWLAAFAAIVVADLILMSCRPPRKG